MGANLYSASFHKRMHCDVSGFIEGGILSIYMELILEENCIYVLLKEIT